ncbi:MAG: VOC family protein [Acidimicrobiales bacterium]
MDIDVLFASSAVSDLGRAQEWYEAFFGRPPDVVPNEHEVMWKATDSAWVYVIDDAGRAGHGVITLAVPQLEETIAGLATRGVTTRPIERVGDAGRKAIAIDPDGNSITLIEVGGAR